MDLRGNCKKKCVVTGGVFFTKTYEIPIWFILILYILIIGDIFYIIFNQHFLLNDDLICSKIVLKLKYALISRSSITICVSFYALYFFSALE